MEKKNRHILMKILLWTVGIWISLIVIAQVILSSPVLTDAVNRFASEHVDGDIAFSKVQVSLFKRFPKVTMTLEDFSITYPAERFDSLERAGVQGHMMYHGCSEAADTLASFKEFSASVRLFPLIAGDIHIPHITLVKPRIFAHSYADGSANWDMFRTGEGHEEEVDSDTLNVEKEVTVSDGEAPVLPALTIGHIRLTEHPHVVYTDSRDTVFAMIDLKSLTLNGRLKSRNISKTRIGMHMDSLFVAGRIGLDTLAMGLDILDIHEHRGHMDVDAKAKTFMATRNFGRIRVPIDINGTISFPKDTVPAISVKDFDIDVATVPVSADADIRMMEGRTEVDGRIRIDDFRLQNILSDYICLFIPEAAQIQTDAMVKMDIRVNGGYDHITGELPEISAVLNVPESAVSYAPFPHDIRLGLDARAETGDNGRIDLHVGGMNLKTAGMDLNARGALSDILGEDPQMEIDGYLTASLDSLESFVPDSLMMHMEGSINAQIKGNARMSHLTLYNFSRAALDGSLAFKDVHIHTPGDTICVKIDTLGVKIGPESIQSRRDPSKTFKLLALNGLIGNADIRYRDEIGLMGKEVRLTAKNSIPEGDDTTRVSYLGGTISADILTLTDSEGSNVLLDETVNRFQMIPKRGQPTLPMLTFSSRNKRITLKTSANRAILTDSEIKAKAAMNTLDRKARAEAFRDSLARVYPDIPRDSLFRHMMKQRKSTELPEWLKEEDFRKSDIDIRLDKSLAKYFREWDLDGSVNIRTGIIMTPYFPLRNILRGFECSFNNNEVRIDSLKVMAGESEIAAKGKLTGLKRALLGRGTIKLDLGVGSDKMNANELLRAYNAGAGFNPENVTADMEQASNSEFLKMVTTDTTGVSDEVELIVVPANLNADIRVDASNITYSDLDISKATAKLLMKERCIQVTETEAHTNMGKVTFDGFYSTRTKKDLRTGFSLNLIDITAEKVISLMPSIDTIMPLLKSFKGLLNCEIAATASLDTNMNIIMPSINGVMRISGEDLSISDSELYNTLAKKLLFKNRKEGKIDRMTVEGVIRDNVFEIFPFVLKIDRYTLAMSGIQNLDMSFKYHVSVLKSPFLIRIGIDLSGDDFDDMKFRIGRAKYKNTNVPVFSTVIDDTKINLVRSIRQIFEKGVENAIRENEKMNVIDGLKKAIGYINAVDMKLEELSEEEQKQLEADEQADQQEASDNPEQPAAPPCHPEPSPCHPEPSGEGSLQ